MRNQARPQNRHFSLRIQSGFTLIELMVAITVLGILLAVAVPTFQSTIRNNQIVTQTNELVGALNYARSEAVKRADWVSVCASSNGTACSGATAYTTGFIVFLDPNSNGVADAGETLIQAYPAAANQLTITAGARSFVRYQPTGTSAFAETFAIVRPGCIGDRARQVAITITGRITTTRVACP